MTETAKKRNVLRDGGNYLSYTALCLLLATGFAASPAAADDALIHRWSFNNSLEDSGSIGGKTAVLGGNAALYGETSVRVNAGGNGTSWVELGANPIPSDLGDTPFTIPVCQIGKTLCR